VSRLRRERLPVGKVFALLDDTTDAALDIVGRGKAGWDTQRIHRLAGEAVIVRVGELANHLPMVLKDQIPRVRWRELTALRNASAHEFDRLDTELVWRTLQRDVPQISREIDRWQGRQLLAADRRLMVVRDLDRGVSRDGRGR
jgi:uncharacterized protein with HEPN domain